MKVLHLIDSGGLYGAEKMLLALVSEQLKQGIEPTILSIREPEAPLKALEKEARESSLPIKPWPMSKGFNLLAAFKILRWARQNNFSLLHSHGYKANILFGFIPKKLRRIPLITTVHGYVNARFPRKMWFYELLDRFVLRNLQHVVFVRKGMDSSLKRLPRSTFIPNGIAVDSPDCPDSITGDLDHFIASHHELIVSAGRLSPEKGFDVLISAFRNLHMKNAGVGLIIGGEGAERPRLQEMIRSYGLQDHVTLPGYIPDMAFLMEQASLLAIPSHTEGLPIVLLEAMRQKCPVIATSVGGIPEALDYGNAGFIVPPGDSDRLGDELIRIFSHENLRADKSQIAYNRFVTHYSSGMMASRYHSLYQQVVSENQA